MKKNFLDLFGRRNVFLGGLLLTLIINQISCSYFNELRERRDRAEGDLDLICKKIPIPNNFVAVSSDKTLDLGKVAFFRRFRTKASCETARQHFFAYFINDGWNPDQMKIEQSRGGMESLDFIFRNNEFVVWVACQNDVDDGSDKQITVSCSWGLR